jgi:hypothetical protein
MEKPYISLFASAARPKFWMRLYNSLLKNKIPFEICFVGPNAPDFTLPDNFHFQKSNCKPSQCYEAARLMCQGEIVGWTADDANYDHYALNSHNGLDLVWQAYENNDKKIIILWHTINPSHGAARIY